MKKALITLGILALITLIVFSEYSLSVDGPFFAMTQGPEGGSKTLSVSSCTPSPGYDFCYQNSYYYHGASPYVQIQGTNLKGKTGYGIIEGSNQQYYIDEVYVNIKHIGDRFTYLRGKTDWGNPCGSVGCIGENVADGKFIIATAPAKNPSYVYFLSWDKDYSGSYWAWSSVFWGWVGNPPNYNFYVIDCYDDSDCESGQYCDKSGSWESWSCEVDPCSTMPEPENICDDFDLWSQKCVYGDIVKDQIIETNSIECGCVIQEPQNTCVGFDLWSQKQEVECVEGLVPDELIEEKSSECGYVCTEGETITFKCTDGTEIITQQCLNNEWIDIEVEQCPLNWINLEMILESYIEEIKMFLEELL